MKFASCGYKKAMISSPSARRVWIEIAKTAMGFRISDVTLREEGVD